MAVRFGDEPLLVARLHGVLRARRLPFTMAIGHTDAPREIEATVQFAATTATAHHVAARCRRIVGVRDVRCAPRLAWCLHETAIATLDASVEMVRNAVAALPGVRILHAGPAPVVALGGSREDLDAALAVLAGLGALRLRRGAALALPLSPPEHPASPEEQS